MGDGARTSLYSITTFNNNQSIYFDPMGKMQIIQDKWTLIVYYNLDPYWEGIEAFEIFLKHLNERCMNMNADHLCHMILLQLQHEFSELQYYNDLLLNQHFIGRSRQRRGLVNGIGYLANSLFGVLDERFAEQYSKDIELVRQNQNHLLSLWKNQTSVLESEYNLLKRTEELVAKQHKTINRHLMNLDKQTNNMQAEIKNMSIAQDFTLSFLIASNILQNIKMIQENLLETITDIYHGQINMRLLTAEQLREELHIISGHLTEDIRLPIENIQQELHKIYKLLKVKARMMQKYLIFEVIFPLLNRDKYKLYKIITIPHQVENNIEISIFPIAEYTAISLRKDTYLKITNKDLYLCLHEEGVYLCPIRQPIYHLSEDKNFCQLDQTASRCKMYKTSCTNKWLPLNNSSYIT